MSITEIFANTKLLVYWRCAGTKYTGFYLNSFTGLLILEVRAIALLIYNIVIYMKTFSQLSNFKTNLSLTYSIKALTNPIYE